MDPNTEMILLIERTLHATLSVYKQIYDEKNETNLANHHRHISEKNGTSSKRASGRPCRRRSRGRHGYHRRWRLHAHHWPWRLSSGTRCGGGRQWVMSMILTTCRPQCARVLVCNKRSLKVKKNVKNRKILQNKTMKEEIFLYSRTMCLCFQLSVTTKELKS